MSTIFSKIIKGDIPSYKIAEDDRFFAFLDINPVAKGHTLVVPKEEIDYIFDLPEELLVNILPFSKDVAEAIEKTVSCKRIGVTVVGLEVPHAHVHLIPLQHIGDISFTNPRVKMSEEEFRDLAEKIRSNYKVRPGL